MHKLLGIWLGLCLPLITAAQQDATALLEKARQEEAAFHNDQALVLYRQVATLQPANVEALCKVSELYSTLGKEQPGKSAQKEYYRSGEKYARQALAANPRSAEANFAMSMAMGRLALMASGEEKIKLVKDIKLYAEKCVQLDPNNFKGYHVLGKWYYEISDLSSLERWLVKVIYDGLPAASFQQAINCYEKSKQLNPHFVLNYLELAKAYHKNGDTQKAIRLLHTMLTLPNTSAEDDRVKAEGRELLKEWE